ncbi:MAG: carbohydrate binding family 9 domain-containing protein, partial [Pseudomonadota bacterium]
MEGNIIVDGALNEAFWQSATVVTLDYETIPDENTPADVRTEVLIAENGDKLLVAFRAFDPEPDSIVAYLSDRDAAYSDDFVGIVLDTFNDERRAFEFFANPLGIQMDLTFDDVNGNEDDSWDAIWDSAWQITDDGFIVEGAGGFDTGRRRYRYITPDNGTIPSSFEFALDAFRSTDVDNPD